jgi:type IV pilus assembly protein PilE
MVVVAVIGILSTLAFPRFQRFHARARQSEAKNILAHIYTLQHSYHGENDTFTTDLTAVGLQLDGVSTQRYNFSVLTASQGAFTAQAEAKSNSAVAADCTFLDTWTIDHAHHLTVSLNCVTQ